MSTSSVPAIEFTPTGLVIPQESAVLAGVQADMNAAFGGNLNPALETPQGQLASSTAAVIGEKNADFAYFVNQVDPATASGFMQDAIARIYFLDRLPATPTVVAVTCLGLEGVVIPAGALVADVNRNLYACLQTAVIPAGGSIVLSFANLVNGPLPCPIGAITTIYRAINGWDTVTNDTAGVLGRVIESRADFEYRRKQSVAINAVGSLPSIYAAAFGVAGVSDVYVAENTGSTNLVIGSITLVPHSVYVAAVGGEALDIATAIWKKKSVGADWNGNTTVTVVDPSGYSLPRPSYQVKFQTPIPQPIYFKVELADIVTLPANIVDLVKAAIVNAFNGGDGGPRARIGATIYASRYYAPVSNIDPGSVEILSILLGYTASGPAPSDPALTLDIAYAPTITVDNVAVELV